MIIKYKKYDPPLDDHLLCCALPATPSSLNPASSPPQLCERSEIPKK